VRDYVLIPKRFWNEPLSADYLAELQGNFDAIRDAGMKASVRFLYDWSMNNRDPEEAVILSHLDQLKPLIQKNSDVIAWMQAGLFGGCGEGCRSDHGYVQDVHASPKNKMMWAGLSDVGRRIYQRELLLLPKDRMMTMRYPRLKWDFFRWNGETAARNKCTVANAFDGSEESRIGFYNQGFMGNEDHYAMFQLTGEREFMAGDSEFVVVEGEISKATPYNMKKKQVVADMKMLHQTAFNGGGDDWDKVAKAWKENGDYAEVCRRLGYRLRLVQATVNTTVAAGGTLELNLQMTNDGFARVMNPRAVEVVLQHSESRKIFVAAVDSGRGNRLWFPGPGEVKDLRIVAGVPRDLVVGEYDVYLHLADPAARLRDRAEYAIRLANQGVWESGTGWNNLQAAITVGPPTGEAYKGDVWFAAKKLAPVATTSAPVTGSATTRP
jgi:hypothetical protein